MKFSLINFKSINKIYLIIIIVGIIFCLYASNLRYIFIKIVYKDTVIAIVDNNEIFGRDISLNGCINKELYFKEEINKSVSSNPSNMFIQKKVIYNGTNKFEQQTDSYYFNNYTSKDVSFSLIRVKLFKDKSYELFKYFGEFNKYIPNIYKPEEMIRKIDIDDIADKIYLFSNNNSGTVVNIIKNKYGSFYYVDQWNGEIIEGYDINNETFSEKLYNKIFAN